MVKKTQKKTIVMFFLVLSRGITHYWPPFTLIIRQKYVLEYLNIQKVLPFKLHLPLNVFRQMSRQFDYIKKYIIWGNSIILVHCAPLLHYITRLLCVTPGHSILLWKIPLIPCFTSSQATKKYQLKFQMWTYVYLRH